MTSYTRSEQKQLRKLVSMAYARELARELETLEGSFREWRAGTIDPHELSDRIHAFHDGPSRELWKLYNGKALELLVARAVEEGWLTLEEVPSDVHEPVRRGLAFLRRR